MDSTGDLETHRLDMKAESHESGLIVIKVLPAHLKTSSLVGFLDELTAHFDGSSLSSLPR